MIDDKYEELCNTTSDIQDHLPKLKELASKVNRVTEFGMRYGLSTIALLAGRPKRLVTYDIVRNEPEIKYLEEQAKLIGVDFQFKQEDTGKAEIEPTDLLFIDSLHTASHLAKELRCADKVSKYIVFHDITLFGVRGEDGQAGLLSAIWEFLRTHKEWKEKERYTNCNGLLVLERS